MTRKTPKPRTPQQQAEVMEMIASAFARAEMPIQALWRRFHEEQQSPEYEAAQPPTFTAPDALRERDEVTSEEADGPRA